MCARICIEVLQHSVQASLRQKLGRLGADAGGGGGNICEPFGQGTKVKPRAAHNDRAFVSTQDRANVAQPIAHGIAFGVRHMAI